MSRDGLLPDDVTEDMVPGNRPEDRECELPCPCAPDAPERCTCGELWDPENHREAKCEGDYMPDDDPQCTCPSLADIRADRAERLSELRQDH